MLAYDTLQVHAGQQPDSATGATAVPIYASAGFCFDPEESSNLFGVNGNRHIYSRISNPTVDVFEKRIAALEGGCSAIATSSGMSAQFVALLSLAHTGDNIVSSASLYGGTLNQLKVTFKGFGVEVRFARSDKIEDFSSLIDNNTKAIFTESIGNPQFLVNPIKELADLAHENSIPLVVDNTLGMGGYLMRPIDYGADIVVQSATKWIGGHGTTIAGVIVDSGKFNWTASGKFPYLADPSEGVINAGCSSFGAKARMEMLRDMGPSLNPVAAFLLLMGVETLSLRAQRQCDNALKLARFLTTHRKVAWVSYLGLQSHVCHTRAKNYFRAGAFGGVLAFGIKGGPEAPIYFIRNLKIASHLANLGDTRTLVICPSTSTHIQSTEEEKLAAGVTNDLIRVSLGIEAIEDIIEDFDEAFKSVQPVDVVI
ncbi:O-acetylhomoserine ami [Gymnopus androsaceus JB14]|uniref:O-acetylhomoserine ami n=1 Tax=Gymnopus androsaceus JB14 TaxID=1447944 RepID=A0A6A4GN93_9AGAR|nr:O-acetylhomoserine ami [Gymnopus androsaceus JB14]